MEDKSLNGFADVPVTKAPPLSLLREEMERITSLLRDPDFDVVEVLREITGANCTLAIDFVKRLRDPALALDLQHYATALWALREIRKSVMDSASLDKRDQLNFDGRKCAFLMQKLSDWFTKGMEEGRLTQDEITTVWEKYRAIVTVEEPVLRRTIQEMDSRARECQSKI